MAVILALSGCVTVNVNAPHGGQGVQRFVCDAGDARRYIGLRPGDVQLPPGQPVRVLGRASRATTDYRPDRLTLFVGDDGIIRRVGCG